MKTNKSTILIIALLALVSLMIAPVMAETLTGTLGGSNFTQFSYSSVYTSSSTLGNSFQYIFITSIEDTFNTETLVHFDSGAPCTFDAGAPLFAQTPFVGQLTNTGGRTVVTGEIGYARLFDIGGTEIAGYQFLIFNDWNISSTTGDQFLYLNYTRSGIYNLTSPAKSFATENPPSHGDIFFRVAGGPGLIGSYLRNTDLVISADYFATKPGGIGISGYIEKTTGSSRAFIFNGTPPYAVVSNEGTVTQNRFNFSVSLESVKLGILDSTGTWYNSSILFAPVTPTVTPTPATTLPAGYVRNNLYIWDQNDAQIIGADVDVLDVEAGTWTNTTADADGWITIDTLPYHTVNVYAHYPTSNIYLPNEILGLETGYYGGHNWVLVLYPYVTTPDGFVTLYINTRDYNSKAVLTGVNLQIKNLVTGATTGHSAGSKDSVSTVVTNATNYQITGSKPGYLSKSITINSGNAASKTVVVELSRATVSPTPTPTISGQPTAVPTQDENDPILHDGDTSLKAQEMMNWLAMNGMDLVQLCFLVTVLALLGVKLGK